MTTETTPQQQRGKPDTVIAATLTAAFLVLFVATLCPTVYLGDSGEITTAIATGGIIHPPGYPLFALLGRISLALIPVGEPAFRIGCVVAAAAAGAVGVLYLLCRELGCFRASSIAAAAMFGLGYSFWSQSVRVEVYSLHVLLGGLALLFCLRYRSSGRLPDVLMAALSLSLGLAHHVTIVLLLPGLLLICGRRLWTDASLPRRLAAGAAVLCAGPLFYGLLFLWAQADPLQNWGRPTSLPALWTHVSARIYQDYLRIPVASDLTKALASVGQLFTDNFPYATFLLPLAGGVILWKRDRGVAAGLLLAALLVSGYNLCYDILDISGYFLSVWLIGAALLAVALDSAREYARKAGTGHILLGLVCIVLPTMQFLRNERACNLSRATFVREFARHKLEHCDPNSVLITQGDQDSSPVLYVHDVLKVRPDVAHIDVLCINGMWSNYDKDPSQWYLHRLRKQGVDASLDIPADNNERLRLGEDRYLINLLTNQLSDRPICTTFAQTAGLRTQSGKYLLQWAQQGHNMLPQGIILSLQPKNQPVKLAALLEKNRRLWDTVNLPDLSFIRTDQEMDPHYFIDQYVSMMVNYGYLYERSGDSARAEKVYEVAAAWAPASKQAAEALATIRKQRATASLSGSGVK